MSDVPCMESLGCHLIPLLCLLLFFCQDLLFLLSCHFSANGPIVKWSTVPVCPSLMCSFNRGKIEGTNSSKICV